MSRHPKTSDEKKLDRKLAERLKRDWSRVLSKIETDNAHLEGDDVARSSPGRR